MKKILTIIFLKVLAVAFITSMFSNKTPISGSSHFQQTSIKNAHSVEKTSSSTESFAAIVK